MEIKSCVFCNMEENFRDEQMLYRGKYFYVVVPKGQIIEGYIIISPYKCKVSEGGIRSLSTAPKEIFDELKRIILHIKEFYKFAYGIDAFTYYEQGRGAEGNEVDDLNAFPIHSHVCTLPSIYDFQEYMGTNYDEIPLQKMEDVDSIQTHYLLLSHMNKDNERICAYIGKDEEQVEELSHFRFKKIIAELLDCKEREQWRMCAETDEEFIQEVISKYRAFVKTNPITKL